jgi:hypothetical protein
MRQAIVSIAALALALDPAAPAAGQEQQTTLIPIQAFVPVDDQQQYTAQGAQFGYLFGRGAPAPALTLWAPLGVPVGVDLDSICVYVADSSASTQVTVTLVASTVSTDLTAPDFAEVAQGSSGLPAIGGVKVCLASIDGGFSFPWRVRTTLPLAGWEVVQYFLRVSIPAQGGAGAPSGVGPGVAVWRRAISDAPGTATFDDVGTGDAFFQYVEALAASGAMTSCDGGPNFCPDAPVSRKQLALVLARALGVYWPN